MRAAQVFVQSAWRTQQPVFSARIHSHSWPRLVNSSPSSSLRLSWCSVSTLYKTMVTLELEIWHHWVCSLSSLVSVLALDGRLVTRSIWREISVSRLHILKSIHSNMNRPKIGFIHDRLWTWGLECWRILLLGSDGLAVLWLRVWRISVSFKYSILSHPFTDLYIATMCSYSLVNPQ